MLILQARHRFLARISSSRCFSSSYSFKVLIFIPFNSHVGLIPDSMRSQTGIKSRFVAALSAASGLCVRPPKKKIRTTTESWSQHKALCVWVKGAFQTEVSRIGSSSEAERVFISEITWRILAALKSCRLFGSIWRIKAQEGVKEFYEERAHNKKTQTIQMCCHISSSRCVQCTNLQYFWVSS